MWISLWRKKKLNTSNITVQDTLFFFPLRIKGKGEESIKRLIFKQIKYEMFTSNLFKKEIVFSDLSVSMKDNILKVSERLKVCLLRIKTSGKAQFYFQTLFCKETIPVWLAEHWIIEDCTRLWPAKRSHNAKDNNL